MKSLARSIKTHGIQVPLTVYPDGSRYILIDGERRWRCAKLLNIKTTPCIIMDKPTPYQNLIMMYNIHALREQWDYFTIASKLEEVIDLFEIEFGRKPNEIDLSSETGLTRGQIRRCQLIMKTPPRFKQRILEELRKPKVQQRVTEDFFIEMERNLKTVINRVPEFAERRDEIRDVLVEKYEDRRIKAVTDFRMMAKIATAVANLNVKQRRATKSLSRIFTRNNSIGIEQEYQRVVAFGYVEKKAQRAMTTVLEFLNEVVDDEKIEELDEEFFVELVQVREIVNEIIAEHEQHSAS